MSEEFKHNRIEEFLKIGYSFDYLNIRIKKNNPKC